jgi:threonine/homoserine/homoserine lactone efflux protein
MPTNTQLSLFCITACVLILTPGPNFIYVLTRGTTQGRRPALMAAAGLGCGVMLHTMLAGIGISALLRSSYLSFQIVKYGGSLYLIYLGVKILMGDEDPFAGRTRTSTSNHTIIWQSIVTSMTNPKTILFFLSFLPQFVNTQSSSVTPQLLLLGSIYMLLTIILYGAIGYFAGGIGHWLSTRAVIASRLHWITGGSFIGLGLWAALSHRR